MDNASKNSVPNVLLVEDSDTDIAIIKDAFGRTQLLKIIDVIKDGEEAIDYLRKTGKYKDKEIPGLVLLDINLPKKNGFQVLEEIKTDPNLKQIPVIILTTSDRDEDITQSYAKGACTFVKKPVSFEEFSKTIQYFSSYWALVAKLPSYRSNV